MELRSTAEGKAHRHRFTDRVLFESARFRSMGAEWKERNSQRERERQTENTRQPRQSESKRGQKRKRARKRRIIERKEKKPISSVIDTLNLIRTEKLRSYSFEYKVDLTKTKIVEPKNSFSS